MGKLTAAGLTLIVAAGSLGTARAESQQACNTYANEAVRAQKFNLERSGCRKTGDMWSDNWGNHHKWCLGQPAHVVAAEQKRRMDELTRCTREGQAKPDPKVERCNRYADGAIAAIKRTANKCGGGVISGARWDPNRDGHFRWCMDARPEHVNREEVTRNYDADKCARCFDYQEQAAAQGKQNKDRKCEFTGPKWSEDRAHHFRWCWNLQASHRGEPAAQTRERDAALKNCPAGDKKKNCEAYALRAISQYDERRKLAPSCGEPKGVMWHNNRQNHFGWCVAVSDAERVAHDRARDEAIGKCRGTTTRPSPGPATEQCLFSAVVKNKTCVGSERIRPPGSLSAMGCGDTEEKAGTRAKASFSSYHCLSDDETPDPGCCSYTLSVSRGCLCSAGTLMRRPVPIKQR